MTKFKHIQKPFKPRARLLSLLGDQLIRDAGIAVFELVKNAYDADATHVSVSLLKITDPEKGQILIRDNGHGMTLDIVTNVWLEPGTDFRERQSKSKSGRTKKFNRLPLGEKGVGRFASHKLGKKILLVTRALNSSEVVVEVNWEDFKSAKYLDEQAVDVFEREPEVFTGRTHGTLIKISGLRENWDRKRVRELYRSINSICSPYSSPTEFRTEINIEPHSDWIKDLPDVRKLMESAIFRSEVHVKQNELTYDYAFEPPSQMDRVKGRKVRSKSVGIKAVDLFNTELRRSIGNFSIDLRIFDLDRQVLAFLPSPSTLREYMRFSGGIRVYRDGVRVFDYGEPGNDWLQLGVRRVNIPTLRLSNNQIIGAVHLSRSE